MVVRRKAPLSRDVIAQPLNVLRIVIELNGRELLEYAIELPWDVTRAVEAEDGHEAEASRMRDGLRDLGAEQGEEGVALGEEETRARKARVVHRVRHAADAHAALAHHANTAMAG